MAGSSLLRAGPGRWAMKKPSEVELTVQFNAERQAYNAIGRERDDLRAKLAEAEKRAEAAEASEKAERLRHEAAERELLRQAEAAEARVRELEAREQLRLDNDAEIWP